MKELQTPLARVLYGGASFYGGTQRLLPGRLAKKYGCGLTAAANVICHLRGGGTDIDSQAYNKICAKVRHRTPLGLLLRGTNGWFLAVGMNLYFLTEGMGRRAFWCHSRKKLWDRVDELLNRNIPVILSIGPAFPAFWRRDRLALYAPDRNGKLVAAQRTRAHFVTVTAADEDTVTVSSWGGMYVIRKAEYEEYARKHSNFLMSNIMYVK